MTNEEHDVDSVYLPSFDTTIHIGDEIELRWITAEEASTVVGLKHCSQSMVRFCRDNCSSNVCVRLANGGKTYHCLNNKLSKVIVNSCINKVVVI